MSGRLRDYKRRGRANRMEGIALLVLALSTELRVILTNQHKHVQTKSYRAVFFFFLFQRQWAHHHIMGSFSVLANTDWWWGGWAHSLPISPQISPPPSFLTKTWKSFMKSAWGFTHPEVDIWVELSEERLILDLPHLPSRELHQINADELSAGNSCGLMFDYHQT